ncbi:hypothetical protein B0I35DRAFT_406144 [Stachybotrys elegans]|uniref:Uncharacterized protein n=1 Tax=Stachybotrys elegans TaxID=80388 RepID=A0A8K0ST45_9HYPO|nr:hypothetical protein B0I35DRAFT_406144 [Stachybotrys elegans]
MRETSNPLVLCIPAEYREAVSQESPMQNDQRLSQYATDRSWNMMRLPVTPQTTSSSWSIAMHQKDSVEMQFGSFEDPFVEPTAYREQPKQPSDRSPTRIVAWVARHSVLRTHESFLPRDPRSNPDVCRDARRLSRLLKPDATNQRPYRPLTPPPPPPRPSREEQRRCYVVAFREAASHGALVLFQALVPSPGGAKAILKLKSGAKVQSSLVGDQAL